MEKRKNKAEKIFYNGKIYTVNEENKWVEAIAICDRKILGVGSNDEIMEMKDSETEVRDLAGAMVMPGFIDSHAHPTWGGTELLYKVNLFDCTCISDYEAEIRKFIEKNPESTFIQGVGWVNPHFEEMGPSKKILDSISMDIPMVFDSADHHSIWANSKAIELAGVSNDTEAPDGGGIERDGKTGEPLGTFRETAQDLIKKIIPSYTKEQYKAGILE
ncbi:MAG: amidohydrolase family protein, partial [Anaerovorax sp.]